MTASHVLRGHVAAICALGFLFLGADVADAHKKHAQPEPAPQQADRPASAIKTDETSVEDRGTGAIVPQDVSGHRKAGEGELVVVGQEGHGLGLEGTAYPSSLGERLVSWLGSFHPAAVHFPIGLLLAALFAEVMFSVSGNSSYVAAGRFCIRMGALGALLAVALGWFYAGFKLADTEALLTTHRWIGTATGLWALLLWALSARANGREKTAGRGLYRAALLIGAGMVAVNGFYGGLMVHGAEHHTF